MSANAMRSPGPCNVSSPIYTPAVLQGSPEWALPTPSPSAMMRCPHECDLRGGTASAPTPVDAPLVPPELLWGVCMPFIQEMLKALQQAMHQEVANRLARIKTEAEESQRPARGHSAASADNQEKAAAVGPFQSLFNPTPKGWESVPSHRARRTAPADETLHEETGNTSEHEREERSSSTRTTSPGTEARSRGDDLMKGRVTLVPSSAPSIGSSSKGTSPMMDESDPPLGYKVGRPGMGGSLGSSPVLQGIDPSRHAGGESTGPLYLKWQEQHPGQGWKERQAIPSSSTSGAAPHLTFGQQCTPCRKGDKDDDVGSNVDGESTPDGDRSVMVCRHWKSKGWCRLEEKCKFLHPEHKRGTSMKKGSGRGSGGSGAAAVGSGKGVEATGETVAKSAKSRRGGKSRRNAQRTASMEGEVAPASMAVAPGLVQGGRQERAPEG